MSQAPDFDVLLSFAGPERHYARAIRDITIANGLRVFFDEEFQHEIWGKHLVEYFDKVYRVRGRFVLVLLSQAYRESAYTKIERRASLDRMIRENAEYLLPVKVDDSWIDGLSRETAYLDLRTLGVLGVSKLLLQKIQGPSANMTIPDGLNIPRVPRGSIPSSQLAEYLVELCIRPQVTLFGTLVYDETNVALRRLLKEPDYWDALDKASGPNLEVFAIRDTVQHGSDAEHSIDFLTAASMSRAIDRGYYFSKLLNEYFGQKKTRLVYPSFLLFIVKQRRIQRCWLIPFHRASTEDTFNWLVDLFSVISKGVSDVGNSASTDVVLLKLKELLLKHKYKLYIQSPPSDAERAVRDITAYVEHS